MARVLYIGYLYVFALPFCFGVYILSGNPEYVVLGDNVTVTLTCVVDDSFKIVTWSKDNIPVAGIKNDCEIDDARDTNYTYTCDLSNNTYYLTIPPDAITDGIQNSVWLCLPVIGTGSNTWSLTLSVPVTTVTLTPAGDNNVVDIVEGEKQTFTCTTDSSRPAAWIQWYIGRQNVTNQATSQARQEDGDKFISSSSLVYTGRDGDHNTVISCQAVNIEGRQKVNSTEKSLYIQSPTTTAEQQTTTHEITTDKTTTHETTTDETTTHETTTDETTTHETTTMETNNGSTDNLITIIIGIILGACVLIGIIIIIIIVLVKKRCHKSDNVKTTKQENYNETREPTANKTDTLDHRAMQHGKPRNHAVSKPGNPGLVYAQYDNHVGYDDGNRGYDRRNYYGNPEHEPRPKEPTADYNRKNDHGSHL